MSIHSKNRKNVLSYISGVLKKYYGFRIIRKFMNFSGISKYLCIFRSLWEFSRTLGSFKNIRNFYEFQELVVVLTNFSGGSENSRYF
jgi:hypothetical protein